MGGVLLMAADVLARWVMAPQELPVGVLTAVLGGGYLLWLMHRQRTGKGACYDSLALHAIQRHQGAG
jgi:iron complex transport system permease protein